MALPVVGILNAPYTYSPVYGPNIWTFHATFSSPYTLAENSKVYADIHILKQNNSTVLQSAGRFKVPVRQGNVYNLDVSNVLKSFLTFPYDDGTILNYDGVGSPVYVNECAGFGDAYTGSTGSYPTLAPSTESIVKYNLAYGIEYKPVYQIDGIYNGTGLTQLVSTHSSVFCAVGDVITIQMESAAFSYFNATASVTSIGSITILGITETIVATDIIWDPSLSPSGVYFTRGYVTLVQHPVGTSPTSYAYNGVSQYGQNNFDFSKQYLLSGAFGTENFMTDWGLDFDHPIPIQPGQSERGRFLFDFDGTGALYNIQLICDIYDTTGTHIDSQASGFMEHTFGGASVWKYKCYTVQLFNSVGTLGGWAVLDGYRYNFYLKDGSGNIFGNLFYIGSVPCSLYDNYRIKFLNRQGSWAYWNFYRDSKQTTEISRTEYKRPLQWDYSINSTDATNMPASTHYSISKLRGQSILSMDVQETFSLNSDWITEQQYAYLQQLVTSPEVYIFYDTYTTPVGDPITGGVNIPIIITDTNYVFKTLKRDRLFNLTINYKYAYSTKIQNR